MQTLRFVTVASAALLIFGCGDDRPPPSDTGTDTSTPTDTGTGDTGATDTSVPTDTGGRPDSGGGGSCGGDACDLVTGGGCGAGQGCQFLAPMMGADPAAMCVPAGTAGDGADCMSYMDCQEGFSCVTPMGAMMGTCQHYCCPRSAGPSTACPTGQTCTTTFAGTDVGFCSFPDDCDPVGMTGCAGAEACYPGPDGTYQCAMPGPLAEGAPCGGAATPPTKGFVNECQAGLACLMDQCLRLCNPMTMTGCGVDQMCSIGLTGFDSLGACDPAATP